MGYDMYIHDPMTAKEEAAYQTARAAFDEAVRERDELPHGLAEYQAARQRLDAAKARMKQEDQPAALTKIMIEAGEVMRHLAVSHPGYRAAQQKVDEAYEAMQTAHTSYFRLNIHGMGAYRTVMDELGMLVTGYQKPRFPDLPDGVTWEDVDAAEEETNPEVADVLPIKTAAATYVMELNAHLTWYLEPASGIAVHKLGSNDGWLVTPQEIEAALAAYRTHGADRVKTLLAAELGDEDDCTSYWIEWIAYLERAKARGGFKVC
ncbi:hypothetical protein OG413_45505 [Streptomyces sp. NBC_01433]|uniref:hypothetical protein n=1 Tax=Streptomyces sp. NBC_01433 TaxID=2903864 RepID=UPI00224FC928|nr:hypothetical protein [Streptomyces sp. NBC_01433]MCX4681367.1 hypothetical protein [Streptomyces sp. NBC_01433]MCX4681695.1 hypothetical protein [Streptomyces sp. NBC_01433]MCX4682443.1 hypothetical protein [Streptomyces sp. NBC_01433]